jgi:hypothetical protein
MYPMVNEPEPQRPELEHQDALDIWQSWLENHQGRIKKARPLSLQRLSIINSAISSYGKDNCIKAIIGCKKSDWHMGGNPLGKKYNTIELILRVSKTPEEQARNERRIKTLSKLSEQNSDGDV